jgi:hypothetical protein
MKATLRVAWMWSKMSPITRCIIPGSCPVPRIECVLPHPCERRFRPQLISRPTETPSSGGGRLFLSRFPTENRVIESALPDSVTTD